MKIYVTSILVDDQAKALKFYTEKLNFKLKHDEPVGEYRWLTLVSLEAIDGVELLLEPDVHPAAKTYKQALKADHIPLTSFQVADIEAEYERLVQLGVEFLSPPKQMGEIKIAVLDDTCGNWIQLIQMQS